MIVGIVMHISDRDVRLLNNLPASQLELLGLVF